MKIDNKSMKLDNKSTKIDTTTLYHKIKLIHETKNNDQLILSLPHNSHVETNYFNIEGGQIVCIVCANV